MPGGGRVSCRHGKSRVEIELAKESLKGFAGTRNQERIKVEELNRTYGESFGYYSTIAQWYDVLAEKGEAYTRMLVYQAEVQSLTAKAADVKTKIEEFKRQSPDEAETKMGRLRQAFMYSAMAGSGGAIDTRGIIEESNRKAYDSALKEMNDEYDGDNRRYKRQAERDSRHIQGILNRWFLRPFCDTRDRRS